jgi:hypothetical protein
MDSWASRCLPLIPLLLILQLDTIRNRSQSPHRHTRYTLGLSQPSRTAIIRFAMGANREMLQMSFSTTSARGLATKNCFLTRLARNSEQ